MKNIKSIIFSLMFIYVGFILGACGNVTIASSSNVNETLRYVESFEKNNGMVEIFEYVDKETGVNYIVLGSWHKTGARYEGITITPKLNADGSLYISK